MFVVFHLNFAAYIVYRRYKPREFLEFVWTDCWGNKSNYVSLLWRKDLPTTIPRAYAAERSLGSRREAFLSQNIRTCMCSFTLNPAFHQNSKIFSYNLALPLITALVQRVRIFQSKYQDLYV